jgi:hypothetical protein
MAGRAVEYGAAVRAAQEVYANRVKRQPRISTDQNLA